MLTNLWGKLDGYKTYVLAVLGILIALAGHFWGPFTMGAVTIPAFTWPDVWNVLWNGGLFSALHAKN